MATMKLKEKIEHIIYLLNEKKEDIEINLLYFDDYLSYYKIRYKNIMFAMQDFCLNTIPSFNKSLKKMIKNENTQDDFVKVLIEFCSFCESKTYKYEINNKRNKDFINDEIYEGFWELAFYQTFEIMVDILDKYFNIQVYNAQENSAIDLKYSEISFFVLSREDNWTKRVQQIAAGFKNSKTNEVLKKCKVAVFGKDFKTLNSNLNTIDVIKEC